MGLDFWFRLVVLGFFFTMPGFSLLYGFGVNRFFSGFERVFISMLLSILLIPTVMLTVAYLGLKIGLLNTVVGLILLTVFMLLVGRLFQIRSRPENNTRIMLSFQPLKARVAALIMVSLQASMILAWIAKYPVFHPNWLTGDPVTHIGFTEELIHSGSVGRILPYPPGFHAVAAFITMILGVEPLFTVRYLAAFAGIMFPLSIYLAAGEMFNSWKLGLSAVFFACFFFTPSLDHFIDMGTWPNMLSDSLTFIFIFMFFRTLKTLKLAAYGLLAFPAATLLLIHQSPIMFIGLLLLFALALWVRSRERRFAYAAMALICGVAPATPQIIRILMWGLFAGGGGLEVMGFFERLGGFYHQLYNISPFLYFFWIWFNMPQGLILAVTGCIITLIYYRRVEGGLFAAFMFLSIFLLSFLAWWFRVFEPFRLLIFAIIAASIVCGTFFEKALSLIHDRMTSFTSVRPINLINRYLLAAFILLILAASGALYMPLLSLATPTAQTQIQSSVYDSLLWIKEHVNVEDKVASVELPLYTKYYGLIVKKGNYIWDYSMPPEKLFSKLRGEHVKYVAVLKLSAYYQNFKEASYLSKAYENQYITIFVKKGEGGVLTCRP